MTSRPSFLFTALLFGLLSACSPAQTQTAAFDLVVTSAAASASRGGNGAPLRFDGETGAYLGRYGADAGLTDPRDILLELPDPRTIVTDGLPEDATVLVVGGDTVVRLDARTGRFQETVSELAGLNAGGLVMGPDGDLYAGARTARTIVRFDGRTGASLGNFVPAGVMMFPRGFVFGADGNLYLGNGADPATGEGGGTLIRFDGATGAVLDEAFVTDPELSPLDVILGLDDKLYVSSEFPFGQPGAKSTVRVYGEDGRLIGVLDAGLGEDGEALLQAPRGVGFGPDGLLYVSSTGTGSVLRFDPATGEFIDVFARYPDLNGQALTFVPHQ